MITILTGGIFRSGLESMLGLGQDREDFLGRLRSLTGGQVVAVTTVEKGELSGKLEQVDIL